MAGGTHRKVATRKRSWWVLAGAFSFISGLLVGGIALPGSSWWASPATAGGLPEQSAAPVLATAVDRGPAESSHSGVRIAESAPPEYLPVHAVSPWADFPWAGESPEKACPHPQESPGALLSRADRRLVVIVGDSLIRNSRDTLTTILEDRGFSPVFVCWGGRTLGWGLEQVDHMVERELLPRCLVVNLGVNDVSGSGVAPRTLTSRFRQLSSRSGPSSLIIVEPSAAQEDRQAILGGIDYSAFPDRVRIIPWSEFTGVQPELVSPDGIHDTALGVTARSALIGAYVDEACG
ncbi:MAG: hypothetical protein ACKOT0_06700 [bacterium]